MIERKSPTGRIVRPFISHEGARPCPDSLFLRNLDYAGIEQRIFDALTTPLERAICTRAMIARLREQCDL